VALYGTETTVVPAGSIIRNNSTQDNFTLDNPVTISRQAAIDFTAGIITAVVGQEYWISINAATYRYTAVTGDATIDIASQLYLAMLSSGLELSLDANFIRGYSLESIPFQLQLATDVELTLIASPGNVTAEFFGPTDTTAGALDTITSTLTGWDSVNNIVAGSTGRNLETDDELRLRYSTGVYRLGAGTLPAIQANLEQNIPGLLALQVYENQEDVADTEGRLPHSIEVIAYGGDPQQIANEIFRLKGAGIDTNGSITVDVVDSIGTHHDIHFNRPTPVYIWVKIVVSLYNEEVFPDDGVQQIQAIVAATGNAFGIGKDVIIQRLMGPIYASVPGIANLDITVAQENDPDTVPAPGDYVSTNLAIDDRELSQFDATTVEVTIAGRSRRRFRR
jgi:uncharacterized phage protein gp47/JayE